MWSRSGMMGTTMIPDNVTNITSYRQEEQDTWDTAILVMKAVVMTTIMAAAVTGNLIVIISVMKFQKLRDSKTNQFIVSLAFADFLVAFLVMPFNASQEISGKWIFGREMCDIFNSNDVLFSTASILHLCCISVDRYIAIIHPLQYDRKMSTFRALLMLALTWIASILISYIPIQLQFYTTEEHYTLLEENPELCIFQVNKIYAVVSSSISFWIPCTIMIFLYMRIYFAARRQEKHIRSNSICSHERTGNSEALLNTTRNSREFSDRRKMKREHKAAKTLGIIMGAFVMCYLPFFSWYVSTTMCGSGCPYPRVLGSILFWIGYFNSCLNPVIYAYYNREFRTAFKRLLHIHSHTTKRRLSLLKNNTTSKPNGTDRHIHLVYLQKNEDSPQLL
ncbi:hypothetical protein FSP39_015049 [Pinctada imbricata]|uniref:G-protein coupled receptors family 1 profile domain-containing protein n=1 Tax=Pinctada imbricata TaxID=66713 RepID=A0AA88Y0M6_PINIB|nr:hypothetical protein FSP39_015049 [Pinctada imbricata]